MNPYQATIVEEPLEARVIENDAATLHHQFNIGFFTGVCVTLGVAGFVLIINSQNLSELGIALMFAGGCAVAGLAVLALDCVYHLK